jgi:ABC-type transporter Mla MlaB component
MDELTYKSIMANKEEFELFLLSDNIKSQIKQIEKIDTAGAQVLIGLIKEEKIESSDLSDAIQSELLFLGVK